MTIPNVWMSKSASTAKSSYVKDMMLVHYEHEVKVTFTDEEYLRGKAAGISDRVNHRYEILKGLEVLCGPDSAVESIADMKKMQREDLSEIVRLLYVVTQKHLRIRDLFSFMEKMEAMQF